MVQKQNFIVFLSFLLITTCSSNSPAESNLSLKERRERLRLLIKQKLHKPRKLDSAEISLPMYSYKAGGHTFELLHEHRTRKYYVHVPDNYTPDQAIPAIINFHGGGGSAEGHSKMTQMNQAADEHGFIAVYPRGTRADGNANRRYQRFWNPGVGPDGAMNWDSIIAKQNDVEFTRKVLDDVQIKFNINPERVYATGFSNGAMMAHRVGCDLSPRIKAIAPVSGPFWHFPNKCELNEPLSVMYFHGTDDECAPYEGGAAGCESGIANIGRNFISAQETVGIWRKKNQCDPQFNISYKNGSVTCKTYSQCEQKNTKVTFCTINGGGHTWPGGESYKIPGHEIGTVSSDINANDAMWEFFESSNE